MNIQGLVREPSLDAASRIASAFFDALSLKLFTHQNLEGACVDHKLRGAAPTLTRLEWGGYAFVGLNLLLTVNLADVVTTGA